MVETRVVRLTLDPGEGIAAKRYVDRGLWWVFCRIAKPPRGPVDGHRPLTAAAHGSPWTAELIGGLAWMRPHRNMARLAGQP
ncbi:hypothetical protein AB0368_07325 [Actinoplanes sp. NPDC051475]|uniref:hypothetical protein n=1 Tax=Actinoplanes sp. NPDC051475 TaxID=3157225 RepID=UPI00344B040B